MVCYEGVRKVVKSYFFLTPKEGVGRSNRLGDANKIMGLAVKLVPFFAIKENKFVRFKFRYLASQVISAYYDTTF